MHAHTGTVPDRGRAAARQGRARLDREGLRHDGIGLRFDRRGRRADSPGLAGGRFVTVHAQTAMCKDPIAPQLAEGGPLLSEAEAVRAPRTRTGTRTRTWRRRACASGAGAATKWLRSAVPAYPALSRRTRRLPPLPPGARGDLDGGVEPRADPAGTRNAGWRPPTTGRCGAGLSCGSRSPPCGPSSTSPCGTAGCSPPAHRSETGSAELLGTCSADCLRRVRQAERFSPGPAALQHRTPDATAFEDRPQLTRLGRRDRPRRGLHGLHRRSSG